MTKSKYIQLSIALGVSLLVGGFVVSAPPGSPYNKGETLEPTCAPGDANCTVTTEVAVTDIAPGTAGEIITWDAAGDPTAIGAGSAGQVLTSNGAGSAPSFQAGGGGGGAFTENTFSTTTNSTTKTQIATLPVSEGTSVWVEAVVVGNNVNEGGRYFFDEYALFYRNTGGDVTLEEAGALNPQGTYGGPIISSSEILTFGDSTSQFDISNVGGCRYMWDGTGTDPNFLTNGMYVGAGIEISGTNFSPENEEGGPIIEVTDDYFIKEGPGCFDENDVTIGAGYIGIPVPILILEADVPNQAIDVNVIGKSDSINWEVVLRSFDASS
jgi:hypothetical protein